MFIVRMLLNLARARIKDMKPDTDLIKQSFASFVRALLFMLTLLALSMGLTGCASTRTEYVPQTVYVFPDETLLTDVPLRAPPNRVLYLQASEKEKFLMLFQDMNLRIGDVAQCNSQLSKLREWKVRSQEKMKGDQ